MSFRYNPCNPCCSTLVDDGQFEPGPTTPNTPCNPEIIKQINYSSFPPFYVYPIVNTIQYGGVLVQQEPCVNTIFNRKKFWFSSILPDYTNQYNIDYYNSGSDDYYIPLFVDEGLVFNFPFPYTTGNPALAEAVYPDPLTQIMIKPGPFRTVFSIGGHGAKYPVVGGFLDKNGKLFNTINWSYSNPQFQSFPLAVENGTLSLDFSLFNHYNIRNFDYKYEFNGPEILFPLGGHSNNSAPPQNYYAWLNQYSGIGDFPYTDHINRPYIVATGCTDWPFHPIIFQSFRFKEPYGEMGYLNNQYIPFFTPYVCPIQSINIGPSRSVKRFWRITRVTINKTNDLDFAYTVYSRGEVDTCGNLIGFPNYPITGYAEIGPDSINDVLPDFSNSLEISNRYDNYFRLEIFGSGGQIQNEFPNFGMNGHLYLPNLTPIAGYHNYPIPCLKTQSQINMDDYINQGCI